MQWRFILILILLSSLAHTQDKKETKTEHNAKHEIKIEYNIAGEKDGIKVSVSLDKYLKDGDMYKIFGKIWNKTGKTMLYSRYNTFMLNINEKTLIVYIDQIEKIYAGGYAEFSVKVNEDDYPDYVKDIKSAKGELHIGIKKLTIPLELQKLEIKLKK